MTDLFMGDDAYHGGAFMLNANFGFYVFFKPQQDPTLPHSADGAVRLRHAGRLRFLPRDGAASANRQALLQGPELRSGTTRSTHDTYDDYWKARNLAPHMKNIHCAVLTVGGWFDAEDLAGPFSERIAAIGKFNPGIANGLVIGPWVHGGWAR